MLFVAIGRDLHGTYKGITWDKIVYARVCVLAASEWGTGCDTLRSAWRKAWQLSTPWCTGRSPQLLHLAAQKKLPSPYCGRPNPGIMTGFIFLKYWSTPVKIHFVYFIYCSYFVLGIW